MNAGPDRPIGAMIDAGPWSGTTRPSMSRTPCAAQADALRVDPRPSGPENPSGSRTSTPQGCPRRHPDRDR